jgi:hypothetical protein
MADARHEPLATFVEETREAIRARTDVREQAETVAGAAEDLVAADGWMEEAMDFDGSRARAELHYDDEVGHPGPGFVVKGSVTDPSEPTGGSIPHDHGSTWVVYAVYRGEMEQYRYGWEYDDDARNPELVEQVRYVQGPGDALFLLPGEIHRTNIVSEEPTWVVRIESQHLDTVPRHRYDRAENRVVKH